MFLDTLNSQSSKIQEQDASITALKTENKELTDKLKPLKDKVENMTENENHLRRLLNETNMLSEGYIERINELEAQRIALATDVAALEEEVSATRRHATERFEIARQKQEIESKFTTLEKNYKAMSKINEDLSERAKAFKDISDKNFILQVNLFLTLSYSKKCRI